MSFELWLAFVPQFIDVKATLLPQFTVLTLTFVSLAAVNAFAYALIADNLRAAIKRPSVTAWLTRGGATALIGMGLMTATLRRVP